MRSKGWATPLVRSLTVSVGPKAGPGAQPIQSKRSYGEAEPRRTSGGEAAFTIRVGPKAEPGAQPIQSSDPTSRQSLAAHQAAKPHLPFALGQRPNQGHSPFNLAILPRGRASPHIRRRSRIYRSRWAKGRTCSRFCRNRETLSGLCPAYTTTTRRLFVCVFTPISRRRIRGRVGCRGYCQCASIVDQGLIQSSEKPQSDRCLVYCRTERSCSPVRICLPSGEKATA
jgi:hypothetical protein